MSGKVVQMVAAMLAHENAAVEAALERVTLAIGSLEAARRCEQIQYDTPAEIVGPPLAGRRRSIEVDGAVVWRGEWTAESPPGVTVWREAWLVEPETLAEPAPLVH